MTILLIIAAIYLAIGLCAGVFIAKTSRRYDGQVNWPYAVAFTVGWLPILMILLAIEQILKCHE
jgi:hypothetical protein